MRRFDRILLVDDDTTCLFLYQLLLEEMGITQQVDSAMNGQQALDYINSHCQSNQESYPELILLDINMPVMNGFEFLEAYRQIACLQDKAVQIVLLTSSTARADQQRAQQYGIRHYLTKPISQEKLLEVLA